MIPRQLVPRQLLPAQDDGAAAGVRTWTSLDSRLLVPRELPVTPLDARTNIPAHVPLEVLGERLVVPRDLPLAPLIVGNGAASRALSAAMDDRIAVPADARPAALDIRPLAAARAATDVIEPDVLTTGEVNLLVSPEGTRLGRWAGAVKWLPGAGTLLVHAAVVALVALWPTMFPYRPPTQQELELATRSLGLLYIPPPAAPPGPVITPEQRERNRLRIDPRVLRQLAPEEIPAPPPGPAAREALRPERELPAAPRPQLPEYGSASPAPDRERPAEERRGELRVEPPKSAENRGGLDLRTLRPSPGRALEESARGAARTGSGMPLGSVFTDRMPGAGGGAGSGGGGQGTASGGLQLLTDTQGVDFSDYLTRVLARVKRNWYQVMPESAKLGEQGRVVLQFHIMQDGSVPAAEPALVISSAKEHLDRAAISSIRASSPFQPLPPAFRGPFIELRFIYLYNLPLNYQ